MTKKVSPPQSYVLGLDVFLRTTSDMAAERRGERVRRDKIEERIRLTIGEDPALDPVGVEQVRTHIGVLYPKNSLLFLRWDVIRLSSSLSCAFSMRMSCFPQQPHVGPCAASQTVMFLSRSLSFSWRKFSCLSSCF
jgi:hypothetical protein